MQLNEFQKRFKDLMLDHPDALHAPPEDLVDLCRSGDIALPERLKVYRNNIVGSLTDVMLATFPVMEKLVGKEFLEMMARSFILKNPPNHGCLSLYGEGFAEFIEGFELAKSLPYLPDVARFELALNSAYYAADDRPLAAEALGRIAPEHLENLKLVLRDSVQLLRSRYPLSAIQDFCMSDTQEGTLNLDQGGERLMIFRPALNTQTVLLDEDEYLMLVLLADGQTLGAAVEKVLETHPNFDFQNFLQKHMSLETFRAL